MDAAGVRGNELMLSNECPETGPLNRTLTWYLGLLFGPVGGAEGYRGGCGDVSDAGESWIATTGDHLGRELRGPFLEGRTP